MITIELTKAWGGIKKGAVEEVGNDIGLYIVNLGYAKFISGGVTKQINTKKKKEFALLKKYGLKLTSLSYGRADILKVLRNVEQKRHRTGVVPPKGGSEGSSEPFNTDKEVKNGKRRI